MQLVALYQVPENCLLVMLLPVTHDVIIAKKEVYANELQEL